MKTQDNADIKVSGNIGLLTWELTNNDTLIVSGKGAILDFESSKSWENYKNFITSVVIKDGVKSIMDGIFSFYVNLTSISIPKSVKNIEGWFWCDSLKSVEVDNNNPVYSSENGVLFNKTKTKLLFFPQGKVNKKYIIPKSVRNIESYIFDIWRSFTSIDVEDDNPVYSSENGVLFNKSKTKILFYPAAKTDSDYRIPDGVKEIYSSAFKDCENLTSIIIPNSVRNIRSWAFYHCTSLTSITIPNGVKNIEDDAFRGCTGLTTITIPKSVKDIECDAFGRCSCLISIDVDENNSVYSSEDGILFNKDKTVLIRCPEAKKNISCKFPYNITRIEHNAFADCKNLTSMMINDSVTEIGYSVFKNCIGLTAVTIPNGVTEIGYHAFSGCIGLASVAIPNSVTTIESCAFENCESLTSVKIPDSVTSIGSSAFKNCSNLTSINIPDSIKEIQSSVFSGCINLTSVTIPDGVTSIEDYAFGGCGGNCTGCNSVGCTKLSTFAIPKNVTKIEVHSFHNCQDLTSINVDSDNPAFCSENGVLFDKSKTTLLKYPSGKTDTNYIIPDTIIQIGEYAFKDCQKLTSVTIPSSVTSIENLSFVGCTNLISIIIPNSVTNIKDGAFSGCENLTAIFIPSSVTNIGDGAFENCSKLASFDVSIDNSVYSSVNGVLFNKSKTLLIQYPDAKADKDYVIPNSVITIGDDAFIRCVSLKAITIPSSVTNIKRGFWGRYLDFIDVATNNPVYFSENEVLFNKSKTVLLSCAGGKTGNYIIPDSVISLESTAFLNCKLYSITIPQSVKRVGDFTFYGCASLKHFHLQCEIPPKINWIIYMKTFNGIDKDTCVLHVPYGSKDKYANAEGWKEFTNIQEETE